MAIYRGAGGAGDSNTDATLLEVTEQAVIATTKASEAAASASAATTSETNAATSATASASSATAAASSASGISASVTAAANSATAATNSATAAATAETNAETAETNAETAESNANTSATTATTKAAEAATSATSASTSASTATTKASEASTSASSASTSATTATTKASEATTSATSASTSASTATTKASEATTSATNAATSATAAAASAASIGTDPSFNSVTITGNTALKLPVGTTAQRPTPTTGQFRYNSTLGEFEGYTTEWGSIGGGIGDEYISATPTVSSSEVNKITVSNHSSYTSPVYIVKLGGAVIQHTIASNVITLINLSTTATVTVTVTVSETGAGKLFSAPTSLSMEVTDKAETPTVTSSNDREITVTNHGDYPSTPTYVVKIGSTVVTHTDSNGTLTLDVNGTAFYGTQTCTVTANYTGVNESLGADVSVALGGALFRYIRLTGFTKYSTNPFLSRFAIYSARNGSDSNNGSQITATIDDASYFGYSNTYTYTKAANTNTSQGWWLLGLANNLISSQWIRMDQNTDSPVVVRSVLIGWYTGIDNYHSPTATIEGSNDGTNWTTIKSVTGMTTKSQNSVNL